MAAPTPPSRSHVATPAHLQSGHGHDVPYSRPATPGAHPIQVGWLGLGAMGYLMARNLAKNPQAHPAGSPPLLVYNRTVGKSEKLQAEVGEDKVKIAQSPGQLALECDVIITNLANDDVVRQMFQEFVDALANSPQKVPRSKIFVETSTVYPTLAGELDAMISKVPHARLITSPVFGAPAAADKAQLIIVMSGDYRSKKEVAFLLCPSVGRKVVDLGGNLEKAPTFKLIGNAMILGCLEVLAEGFTMAEKTGIGHETAYELVKDLLPAGPLIAYGDKMVNDKFDGTVGFAIDGGIKDATHIRRLSSQHDCPMPVVDAAHGHLLTARALHTNQVARGTEKFGTLDWSAVVAGARVAAGLDGLDSKKHAHVVKDE